MLRNDRSELDCGTLLKRAKLLQTAGASAVRLALLADVSTQHLVPLLRVLFAGYNIDTIIYEAGYDTAELESVNPHSGLYEFAPQLVVVLRSQFKLIEKFHGLSGSSEEFVAAQVERTEAIWTSIQSKHSTSIIQSTYVVPYERPYGNFGRKLGSDAGSVVAEINRQICQRAKLYPGVFINDIDYLAGWVGRRHFLDERLWILAKSICAMDHLPDVAQNIVDISLAIVGRAIKCVVLDLDNTLWGGVVGDDGLEGIGLGDLDDGGAFHSFQLYLRELGRRGIILTVCSKNNDATARQVFREHPAMVLKEEHIAVFLANWEDKATNIRRISETLNIGLDSMVFVDDNPFERNLVRELIPEIIVPELPEDPSLYVRALSELNLFEAASNSALDGQRNALYQVQQVRKQSEQSFATIDDYLKSLQTTAIVEPFCQRNLSRIAQLIQRSNQFNLTTRRYSEAECGAVMRGDEDALGFTVTVKDKFGDFGLINVVILRIKEAESTCEIDSFLMSCRVLQRGVEQLAMNRIFELARERAAKTVKGRYIPTAKNVMVKDFYASFSFHEIEESGDAGTAWELQVNDYIPRYVHIEIESDS